MATTTPERRVLPDPAAWREPEPITDAEHEHLVRTGDLIRSRRLALPVLPGRRRVSQAELAAAAGISKSLLGHLEVARCRPREDSLRLVAGALAGLGNGDAGAILAELLEACGPALAAPSADAARVAWNRDRRAVRRGRRERKQAKVERAAVTLAAPALEREVSRRLAVRAELDRLGAQDRSLARPTPAYRPGADDYPDGAPRGSESILQRRFEERVVAAVEERLGPARLGDAVRTARRRTEVDAHRDRANRRLERAARAEEEVVRRAHDRDAEREDRYFAAVELAAEAGLRLPALPEVEEDMPTVDALVSGWRSEEYRRSDEANAADWVEEEF